MPCADRLACELDATQEAVYLFSHHVLDSAVRADHQISNAESIRALVKKSGTVRAVFQGHYHAGARNEYDGIDYVTLPAMCEQEAAYFIFEI